MQIVQLKTLSIATTLFQKKRVPFLFLWLICVLFTDLKNIWEYCSKINMQQNTYFKFYIDALYLIVTEAENMPSIRPLLT